MDTRDAHVTYHGSAIHGVSKRQRDATRQKVQRGMVKKDFTRRVFPVPFIGPNGTM